jgi:hypothetical protein
MRSVTLATAEALKASTKIDRIMKEEVVVGGPLHLNAKKHSNE